MIIVRVTLTREGKVIEELITDATSQYAWEIERAFQQVGEVVARKIDPRYYE